jgi:hydroxyethylthiazole kinase
MDYPAEVWNALRTLRERTPLVHNITNYVAMDVSANALLAIGAAPAMVHATDEVEEFTGISHALVVNIGTLSPAWVEGMRLAVARAVSLGKPWVLDPVGAGATKYRTETARELAAKHPTVIRGNASEILAVAGGAEATRGVDSAHASDDAVQSAVSLARRLGCVVAVTGATDYVTDGSRTLSVANGHPMMTRVTALGCSASALVGAFLAAHDDPVFATAAALSVFGLAGEMAASDSPGPGTFRVRLLDALYRMDVAALTAGVRIADVSA